MNNIIDSDNIKYAEQFIEDDKIFLVLRLMKHAAERAISDPNYVTTLTIESKKQNEVHKNKKLIKIVCKYYRIYALTKAEINEVSIETPDRVYEYLIDRTAKILSFSYDPQYPINTTKIDILKSLRAANAYGLNEDFYELQNKIYDTFKDNIIIQTIHSTKYKATPRVPLIRKQVTTKYEPNKTYISIDVKTANYSWLFNYIGNHIFKLGVPETYNEYAKQFIDNQLLLNSKHARQIIFGKVFKKYGLGTLYETDINYITSLFTNVILDKYQDARVALQMDEEIVFLKTDNMIVEDIKEELKKLEPLIGVEMVHKLCVVEYTYRKIGNVSLKNNEVISASPELCYQIYKQ